MASKSEHYYSEYQKNLEAQQNLKYKNKYKKLKRIIKDIVIVSFDIFNVYFSLFILSRQDINKHCCVFFYVNRINKNINSNVNKSLLLFFFAGKCSPLWSSCSDAGKFSGRQRRKIIFVEKTVSVTGRNGNSDDGSENEFQSFRFLSLRWSFQKV